MDIFFYVDDKKLGKQVKKLDLYTREQVFSKLDQLKKEYPETSLIRKLDNHKKATHSIRVGKYRILILVEKFQTYTNINILEFGHRRNIYD